MSIKARNTDERHYHVELRAGQPRFLFDAPKGVRRAHFKRWNNLFDWVSSHGREIYEFAEEHYDSESELLDGELFIVGFTIKAKGRCHYFYSEPQNRDPPKVGEDPFIDQRIIFGCGHSSAIDWAAQVEEYGCSMVAWVLLQLISAVTIRMKRDRSGTA
ncbi:hypothetical protein D9756_002089 [Leucocoprinus leucothites]|uniref:Uncharacterized protein n=1 Tax=Leucocoprinus leucothites TaxID=201217 RepID=A0A8H5LM97_9AGAR|nr:hypothetical protein D9756_002089 [Leucoagaricus leucothites]